MAIGDVVLSEKNEQEGSILAVPDAGRGRHEGEREIYPVQNIPPMVSHPSGACDNFD